MKDNKTKGERRRGIRSMKENESEMGTGKGKERTGRREKEKIEDRKG